jgi:outer membrane protein assembly factor BamE (lipoprotein component of BamABCDE complex)
MSFRLTSALLFVAIVSACTPTVATRGNLLPESKLALVQPASSSKADVERLWGSPSIAPAFDNAVWYYIGETTSQKGIYEAELKKRQIIKVTFDSSDMVASIEKVDPNSAREIEFVERKTPTAGKEFTALQQAIGNLGKFNTDGKKK